MTNFLYGIAFSAIIFTGCISSNQETLPTEDVISELKVPKFEALTSVETGIDFNNKLDINVLKSPFEYINVYNGGGVGLGDINNDGLPDICFTSNLGDNKLYLNKGDFKFEDISESSGISSIKEWSTGVSMIDINQDGYLDIYICRAYYEDPSKRRNLLFVNNGDLTFTEQAEKYGIGDEGYSISAVFFDYDRDGLADLFVGNHPLNRFLSFGENLNYWHHPTKEWTSNLYHNNGDGTFDNVTAEAGLLSYGWTLGAIASDLNHDGWTDLFVAVDHTEPDRYYINNRDGTFVEVSNTHLKHMSHSSMGVDAADINNDGLLDLAVVEMLATNNFNEKTKMASMNIERFWSFVDAGYHYQYMRNMLHLNAGEGVFSEIGQMAGVHRTNWSWACLLADFNNDGWKDFYVTNGYLREYLDKDNMKRYLKSVEEINQSGASKQSLISDFVQRAPTNKVENNFFVNNRDLTFSEKGSESGLNFLGFSSGAAYGDLDKDGDLDLVVSNINDLASIYKNMDRENGGFNYLRIRFDDEDNICPLGTKVSLMSGDKLQYQELTYARGYQSSVEGILHFGIEQVPKIDKVVIEWLDGYQEILTDVAANQELTVRHRDAKKVKRTVEREPVLFTETKLESAAPIVHQETFFDDYKVQVLLPHKMSQLGPFMSVADVNNDGLEDFYLGGAKGFSGALYLQMEDGQFQLANVPSFMSDLNSEDMGSAFFDANNDGKPDLYVASGSNEFQPESPLYNDRLYINLGNGNFQKVKNAIPDIHTSGSCVKPFDFDGDGDLDLFVGGRQLAGHYPAPVSSVLLENTRGFFKDVTATKAPGLQNLGMVTDAVWTDFNGDGTYDLLIVGEWMPLTVFTQTAGNFQNRTADFGLEKTVGWWNRIAQGDIDNDGDMDYVIGNLGTNYKYKASPEKPFHVYAADFDDNKTYDIALGYFLEGDVLYPVRGKQCSTEQCPGISEKYHSYEEYGNASIADIYGDKLNDALHYEATNFHSCVLLNLGNGQMQIIPLPNMAQIAPINAIVMEDFDGDHNLDLLVGGNLYVSEVETGRADAGRGLYLKGNGLGSFTPLHFVKAGLNLTGDLKDIVPISGPAGTTKRFLIGNNNGPVQCIEWNGNGANKTQ